MTHSVIALFCDDIREEKDGRDIIVGIFPDNLNLPNIPGTMERLCLYVRIHLDASAGADKILVQVNDPNEKELLSLAVDTPFIKESVSNARKKKQPYAGIIARVKGASFPVKHEGRYEAIVTIDGKPTLAGLMNVKKLEPTESRTTA